MKKSLIILAVTAFIIGSVFTGCQSQAKKIENAQDKVEDAKDKLVVAKQDLDKALNDSIQEFRKTALTRVMAQEKNIADFKTKIAKEK